MKLPKRELDQKEVQHLYLRAGFGISFSEVKKKTGDTAQKILDEQFRLAANYQRIKTSYRDKYSLNYNKLSSDQRQEMNKLRRGAMKTLNSAWLTTLKNSEATFREKMAFFWHDHFACQPKHPQIAEDYLHILRSEALGNFGDLLKKISKSPAMLQYLNNQQNKKSAPNENFAREVMELFTLGRDRIYTEKDISEAARAFTGWGFNKEGFVFRKGQHDNGVKTVLGQTGNFGGDEVIDILLSEKGTAEYIAEKWVRYFLKPEGNSILQKALATELFDSGYDIKRGLEALFSSEEFFNQENMAKRIKSPIELIASMQRQLPLNVSDEDSLIILQRLMGQTLFDPPNVAGWEDGRAWVDSASLLLRMKLPAYLILAEDLNGSYSSFDDNDQFKIPGNLKKLQATFDIKQTEKMFRKEESIGSYLLQTEPMPPKHQEILDQIIFYTTQPEYQLC